MASISVPTLMYIAIGATAVSAGLSAYESHEQGVATANADKRKARVEAENETQKQIGMRQNMLRALATQNAGSLGAAGTGAESGFGANMRRQLTQGQDDLMISRSNSAAQVSLLDAAASNARSAGDLGAAGDIIGGAGKAASIYAG